MNQPEIKTYKQAAEFLQAGRNKNDRPLEASSTRLIRIDDDTIAVRYHYTDVVTYHRDGSYTFNRGGYHTDTTWRRIEQYSPIRIVEGEVNATWSWHRENIRNGPEDWLLQHPRGNYKTIEDGHPIRICY